MQPTEDALSSGMAYRPCDDVKDFLNSSFLAQVLHIQNHKRSNEFVFVFPQFASCFFNSGLVSHTILLRHITMSPTLYKTNTNACVKNKNFCLEAAV